MFRLIQTETFFRWWTKLRDERARGVIFARLDRLAYGHFGDVAPVGEGISELRVHIGPGYRVYLKQHGDEIVVILCGGDKSSQSRDIKLAKRLFEEWIANHGREIQ